jgi:hypothetical protein
MSARFGRCADLANALLTTVVERVVVPGARRESARHIAWSRGLSWTALDQQSLLVSGWPETLNRRGVGHTWDGTWALVSAEVLRPRSRRNFEAGRGRL